MAYETAWVVSDRAPQFHFDPDVHIQGQKISHAFLSEALPETTERVPKRGLEIKKKKKAMYDFVSVSARVGVSEDVMALIEAREPALHQFFPIELVRKSGMPTGKKFFLLNVMSEIDSVVPERSDMNWSVDPHTGKGYWNRFAPFRLAMRRSVIAGRHIWHERPWGSFFMSDELGEAIQNAALKGRVFNKMIEID